MASSISSRTTSKSAIQAREAAQDAHNHTILNPNIDEETSDDGTYPFTHFADNLKNA